MFLQRCRIEHLPQPFVRNTLRYNIGLSREERFANLGIRDG